MSSNQNRPNNNRSGQNRRPNNSNRNNSSRPRKGVPSRNKKPEPKLNLWQKFLKAIGLYKTPTEKKLASKQPTQNTRVASDTAKKRPARKAPPQIVESSRLYVGNLSYDVSESELIDLFKGFGGVKRAEVVYNKRTHKSKGFAFVEMVSTDDAKRAAEVLHEQPFMGRNMIVNGARTEEEQRNAIENPVS